MDTQPLHQLWDEFLSTWPVQRIREMTLEEYTNPNRDDAFIYWIEKRLEILGSIWGGSAFKFGIYCRKDKTEKESKGGRIFGEQYAWMSKYGQTEKQAFKTVLARILEIIDAVQSENLDIIDAVDFSPVCKWKLAFLYQDREKPRILPIYKKEWLLYYYKEIDPSAKLSKVPYSLLYTSLYDRYREIGDIFEIGKELWERWEKRKDKKVKYWAVPVSWAIGDTEEAEALCAKTEVTSEDVSPFLDKLLSDQELAESDHIALLIEGDVRAVGTLTNVEPGEFSWKQIPVNFPSELVPIPTSETRELDASERKTIWDKAPATEPEKVTIAEDVPLPHEEPPEESPEPSEPCIPKNIILYGPPGTGKTYSTVERALQLIMGGDKVKSMSSDTRMRQFRKLQQDGRIEFVTFHQSYGYEEFVEGLRPVLDDDTSSEVRYELHPGVFKRIALQSAAEGFKTKDQPPSFEILWSKLIKTLKSEGERLAKSITGKTYILEVTSRGGIGIHGCTVDDEGVITKTDDHGQTASKGNTQLIWDHRNELGPDPKDITYEKTKNLFALERSSGGGHHYTAIWMAYQEVLALSTSSSFQKMELSDPALRVQEVLDKTAPGLVDFSFSKSSPQYVLIIDEINRGNISKILGELITLLETDKRLGSHDELKLPLSYSPEHRFAVPPNLHIIGTMNTADRSIALMDVALRRRFSFEELMPEDSVITDVLGKIVADEAFIELVVEIFNTLNKRIRFLYDNDHQLGHAYFLAVRNHEDLREIFLDRIIPLLQEYFYGAWDKICAVLGCPYNESGQPLRSGPIKIDNQYVAPIIKASVFDEAETIGFDHEQYEDRLDFEVNEQFAKPDRPLDQLLPFFLGILNLTEDEYGNWQKRFESESLKNGQKEPPIS